MKCIIDLACEDEKALDVSTVLQVPLMKVDSLKDSTIHPYVVSIRPSKHLVSQALFDIMDFFSFTRIGVVYDGTFLDCDLYFNSVFEVINETREEFRMIFRYQEAISHETLKFEYLLVSFRFSNNELIFTKFKAKVRNV